MRYEEILPPLALSQVVRYFWTIENKNVLPLPIKYRLFAESSPSLVFFTRSNQSIVAGQTCETKDIVFPGDFFMIGVCLYPYSIPLLYKFPTHELTDTSVDFETLDGQKAKEVKEKVMATTVLQTRIQIISDYLLHKLKNCSVSDKGFQAGVREIVRTQGQVTLDQLVDQMGVSHRQAERKFYNAAGFSPKLFVRLIRFHASLKHAGNPLVKSLTDIAYRCGYCDQSHFIREFKEFSGLNPKQYFHLPTQHMADNFISLE